MPRENCSFSVSGGIGSTTMPKSFKIHDRVSWNSEAGRVSGTIVRVRTRNFKVNGYTHHASPDAPQYEIKSAKTDHIAFHKGSALTRLD
jgi:Hypervirulence associated proteins TUDOR domain